MNWSSAFNNNDNKRKQQLFAFVVSSEWVDVRACVRVHVCYSPEEACVTRTAVYGFQFCL